MGLVLSNLSGGYGRGDICKGVTCQVDAGEILCVLGPNGCGKSTLFKLILGFLEKSGGDVFLDSQASSKLSAKEQAKYIAYIPQQHFPQFSYTVLEVVLMGRTSHIPLFGTPKQKDIQAAEQALKRLAIHHLKDHNYANLSGGQRQLVLLSRAICQDAKILVMDEPSASLDYANGQMVMGEIASLAADGYTIVLSTHSPDQPFYCDCSVLLMKDGVVVDTGPAREVMTSKNLKKVYGIDMDILTAADRNGKNRSYCVAMQ